MKKTPDSFIVEWVSGKKPKETFFFAILSHDVIPGRFLYLNKARVKESNL